MTVIELSAGRKHIIKVGDKVQEVTLRPGEVRYLPFLRKVMDIPKVPSFTPPAKKIPPRIPKVNIYQDAGFEYGGQHQRLVQTFSVVTDVAGAHTGNKYLRATGNSVTQDIYNAEYYQVQPGDVFYVEAWIKADAGTDGTAYAVLFEWRDKDKANPGWSSVGSTSNPGTSWVKKSGTVTVPSGKYYMRFGHSVRSDSTTGNWYWDDVHVEGDVGTPKATYESWSMARPKPTFDDIIALVEGVRGRRDLGFKPTFDNLVNILKKFRK